MLRLFANARSGASRGDTIIEVMFAVAVFALIAVTSLALMNQGTATSRRAVEITTVRQQMDAQAEALRFLQAAYVQAYRPGISFNFSDTTSTPPEEFAKIIDRIDGPIVSATKFGTRPCDSPPNRPTTFVLNTRTAQVSTNYGLFRKLTNATAAQVIYNTDNSIREVNGIWIEAVRSNTSGTSGYVDFHIRGCWDAAGVNVPMNLGTIVRLYVPRG